MENFLDKFNKLSGLNESETFNNYPQSATNNAKKVLKWKEEHGDEVKGGTQVGWTRARQIAKRENLSKDTIKRVHQFKRHEKNKSIDPKFKSTPWKDRGYVAWLLWGGDSMINWAGRKADQFKNENVSPIVYINEKVFGKGQYIVENMELPDEFETEMEKSFDMVLNDLEKEVANFAKNSGDRDGQIELKDGMNEAIGSMIAGGVLALPEIAKIIGKASSFVGKKFDSKFIESFGAKMEDVGEGLHHKYHHVIEKIILPFTKSLSDEARSSIATGILVSATAALGASALANAVSAAGSGQVALSAIESGLGGVKANELLSVAKQVIPKLLGTYFK